MLDPFLSNLGTPIYLASTLDPSRSQTPRPSTPGKPPRVDYGAVRRNLKELWETEHSYVQKIQSLLKASAAPSLRSKAEADSSSAPNQDFATPLRHYSKSSGTAIIKPFEATHLFINIEDLVPIAQDFERDLRQVANYIQHTREGLPDGFGEMILRHVSDDRLYAKALLTSLNAQVERMGPYRRWLENYPQSDAIRRELEKSSSSFRQYIERTQLGVREETQQTGGFTEFLAEPFQRISRYRLMLDREWTSRFSVAPLAHARTQNSDHRSSSSRFARRRASSNRRLGPE